MGTLRTKKTEDKYTAYKVAGGLAAGCNLCQEPTLKAFKHWRVINNKFPYDKAASLHHMVIPIEHHSDAEVTPEAWAELLELKKGYLNDTYEFFIDAAAKKKSIPAHYHLHVIVASDSL